MMNICQKRCFGIQDYHGSCCTLEQRDYIIGPVLDHIEFLEILRNKFQGVEIKWEDIFISFEEGSKLFPDRSNWQNPAGYPAMRINMSDELLPCIFYNKFVKACGIYEIRPMPCRTYYCDYLREYLEKQGTEKSPECSGRADE